MFHLNQSNSSTLDVSQAIEIENHSFQHRTFDVVVVGAGIIGTTIAEKLRHKGLRVLLIDEQGVGEGCSKGNAGHFATDIILPLANFSTVLKAPKFLLDPLGPLSIDFSYLPKILPWLVRFAWSAMPHKTKLTTEVLKHLNRPSIDCYQQLLNRIGAKALMTKKGALTLYQTKAGMKANLKHAQLVAQHGVNVEILNKQQVLALEPEFDKEVLGGLFYPDTAHSIEPHELVREVFNSFKREGGEFLKENLQQLVSPKMSNSSEIIRVKTTNQLIESKKVIIACGAWSNAIAKNLGYNIPLETERGYHYMLPQPKVKISRPVTCYEKSFVMTPMKNGLRLAGTVELAGLDKHPNMKRAEQLFDNAKPLLKNLSNKNATSWMGHRPSLPDSLPIISKSKVNNVYFAFGHQHLGLTQAAVTANLVNDLLEERMDGFLEKHLSINRF